MISNQFHVNFRQLPRSRHILCDFKFSIAILMKYHNQTVFVLRGLPCTLKQQKNMFFPRLALSLACTDTPCLSPGDCHLEAGMFEHFHIRVALHFGIHRDTVLNLWKHFHVSFIAYACLRSYHQRVIWKGYGAYTRVTHLCNRLQIACAISWSIPGLYTINAKTGHIHLRGCTPFATADPVFRSTSHDSGELPSSTINWFDGIPDEEFTSLNQSYSLLKAVFTWVKVLNMCGLRWIADFVICISRLPKPTNLQQLSRDLMLGWIVILHNFYYQCHWIHEADMAHWLMRKNDAFATDFVTSQLTSEVSATSENTKNTFCKFQVWLNIWRIKRTLIRILFQQAFCNRWKNIAIFTMHSFICWRVYQRRQTSIFGFDFYRHCRYTQSVQ